MNLKEYSEIVNKTAIYPKDNGAAYTALGLVGESGELYEKINIYTGSSLQDLIKEMGDVVWYCVALAKELVIELREPPEVSYKREKLFGLVDTQTISRDIVLRAAHISEKVKKLLRDGTIDKDLIDSELNSILTNIVRLSVEYYSSFDKVLQTNYDKLMKRRETDTLHGSGDNREDCI